MNVFHDLLFCHEGEVWVIPGSFGARTAPRTHPCVLNPSLISFYVKIYNSLQWLDEKSRQRLRFRHQSQKGISYPLGKYESKIPDTMPVYIEWYEWIDKKKGEIATPYGSLDGGDEDIRIFTVIFENIGPLGSIIKGSFYGKLFDQDEKLHEVTEGKFAIKEHM